MNLTHLYKSSIKALQFARQNGWINLITLINRKMASKNGLFGKVAILRQYDFVLPQPIGATIGSGDVEPNTINWFIPRVGKGSGGHLNIFRFIKNLEELGFNCRIVIVDDLLPVSAQVAKQDIHRWFFPLKAEVFVGTTDAIPPAHFSIATSWQTAYTVRAFQSTHIRCYFVQDFEPWFYPAGSDSLLAEATYSFGFQGFTAGSWLASKLSTEYGMHTCGLGFSFDKELYKPVNRAANKDRRIFFYARPPTARRAFELGLLVLREVCQQIPDAKVVLAGWDVSNYEIPFPCEQLGLVAIDALPQVYASCDVALVLSCTNLSLLPLELMASGVPVVSNDAPHTRWLLDESNSALAPATVEGLAGKIVEVLSDKNYAESLRAGGLEFAACTSWESEAKKMALHLRTLLVTAE
jgi:glycosyltransferase involved in cell wall biosynthesis